MERSIRSLQEKLVLLESSSQCRYDGTTYKLGSRWTPDKGLMCMCEVSVTVCVCMCVCVWCVCMCV